MTEQPKATVPQRLDELPPRVRRRLVARAVAGSALLTTAMLIVYYSLPWDGGPTDAVVWRIIVTVAALVVVTAVAIRLVMRARYPMVRLFEVLVGLAALAVTLFASTYAYLSHTDPAAFSEPLTRTDALYFAVTTTTTVGFGDISAASQLARIVVTVQMVVNVAVVGIAARALIHAARRRVDGP